MKGKSMRAAINAKCKDCIYDKHGKGNWRQQVEACTCESCPLFEFRPVSSGKKAIFSEEAQVVLDNYGLVV